MGAHIPFANHLPFFIGRDLPGNIDRVARYDDMRVAYMRTFDRMGLTYRLVAADSGAMGGSTSAEFQNLADSGEDAIVACDSCEYAANVEVATVKAPPAAASGAAPAALTKVHTPKAKTIEEALEKP